MTRGPGNGDEGGDDPGPEQVGARVAVGELVGQRRLPHPSAHRLGVGAARRVVGGHAVDQLGDRRGQARGDHRGALEPGLRGLQRGALIGAAARQRLDRDEPERVHVGGGPDGLATDLLGREVRRRPDDDAGVGDARRVGDEGHPEVGQVRAAVGVEQDVAGDDVAVQHTRAVDVGERVGDGGPVSSASDRVSGPWAASRSARLPPSNSAMTTNARPSTSPTS